MNQLKYIFKWILLILFLIARHDIMNAQLIFHQDTYHGGVTAGGFSTGMGIGSGIVQLHIEPGSTIRKAFVFAYSTSLNSTDNIIINGHGFNFDSSNNLTSFTHTNQHFSPLHLHSIDFTHLLSLLPTNSFQISIPTQAGLPFNGVFAPYIYIEYFNNSLPLINTCIIINNQNLIGKEFYNLNNLNPISNNSAVGFSIYSDRSNDENIFLNSSYLGTLNGDDAVNNLWNFSGVKGHFYYQNNQLYGLDDDTPDNIMNGTDALANVSPLISNYATNINFELQHSLYPNQLPNVTSINLAFFLTYTSPCDTFSTKHTPDTTVCHGAQVALFASGGQSYEWSPQVGLSCYDCPNPIFSADSSRYYSLRIWNNDSCSKVLPIFIKVNPPTPNFNVEITPSECGDSTGSIKINPLLNAFTYINQTNGDTSASGLFSSLHSGNYHISVLDSLGCGLDTLIHVPETLSVHAAFTSNPNAGISPLTVEFSNQSTGAITYQWIYDNQSSTNQDVLHTFGQDGIYPIVLYAYGNSPLCVDTAYDTIRVYLPLVVDIPNIFTPDNNSVNEQWGVKINVPAKIDVQIFNRWGEVVLNKKQEATTPGFIALWDGGKHVGGVYFYVIRVQTDFEKVEYRGNITLIK